MTTLTLAPMSIACGRGEMPGRRMFSPASPDTTALAPSITSFFHNLPSDP
jgi:hypothetical protein